MSKYPKLPVVERFNSEPRITAETFCQVFDDHSQFTDFVIIDCRSKREYDGGHIKGAIRCHPFENPQNIPNLYQKIWKPGCLYVFHCEFSMYRGPNAYHIFKECHEKSPNAGEQLNAYVLDNGFSDFYCEKHKPYIDGIYVKEGLGWMYAGPGSV
ncbi:hypothetical protein TRFO_33220 [Tritrichomonas foetus]|uniref:protein-tyrosine-phosphatase n=1 Tax=Tritrichomonas foetus TaxID=1144522 RepID=A0A1J4JM28_9EUKA|nr:hypothetical protein TRFO_33220 [Tritrichomonas foetus]|eukprot:OHT00151.1 hypothetical protein TRFO_33220 [Tritrichomonas foetus]